MVTVSDQMTPLSVHAVIVSLQQIQIFHQNLLFFAEVYVTNTAVTSAAMCGFLMP